MGIWVSYWVWSLKSMRLLTSYCLKWKICVFSQGLEHRDDFGPPKPISTLQERSAVAFMDHFFRSLPPNQPKLWYDVIRCYSRKKDNMDWQCHLQRDCALCMFVRWTKQPNNRYLQLLPKLMVVPCLRIIMKDVHYFWYILGHSPNNVHFPFVQEKSQEKRLFYRVFYFAVTLSFSLQFWGFFSLSYSVYLEYFQK